MLKVVVRIRNPRCSPPACSAEAPRIADAHAGAVDLLITDYGMPRMKGRGLPREASSADTQHSRCKRVS
jgi:hypothetical protein